VSDEGAWRPGAAVPLLGAPALGSPQSPCVNGASASGETTPRSAPASRMTMSHDVAGVATKRRGRARASGRRRPLRADSADASVTNRIHLDAGRIDPFGGSTTVVVSEGVREFQVRATALNGVTVGFVPNTSRSVRTRMRTDCDRRGGRRAVWGLSRDIYLGQLWTACLDRDKLTYRYDGRSRGSGT